MRITRKLGLLVGVPLVAVIAFAALAVTTTGGEAVRAESLRRLVAIGAEAGELAYRLQGERAGAVTVLAEPSAAADDRFNELVTATERAADRYGLARSDLSGLPAGTAALLERIDGELGRLQALRDQVAAGEGAASAVAFTYRIVIADLIAFRESVAQAGGAPAEVADRLRAAAALSQATEQVGRQQVAVQRAAGFGRLTPAAAQEITAARTGHIEALLTFDGLANPQWLAALERSATGGDALTAQRLEDEVARTAAGGTLEIDQAEWTAALDSRMQRLRQVEADIDSDILVEVTELRDAQRRLTGGQVAAVVLAVAAAVGLAAARGRPVVRGLRRLRDAAHLMAHEGLPAAVNRLEHQEGLGGLTPDQFADQTDPPVQVRGRDELAEVGVAFNTVHREAIRTAAEQAQLRLSVAAIMLNLARRGQKLTDKLTAALDEVEREELNPKRLEQLYQLDLMATLLGGTNESLLVLGGAGAAQVRTADEPLADVLRAALSRVEQYQRIEPGVVDDGVAVRASVVDDVVKLLAELLDNACRYSPPQALVRVDARWLSDRVIVQVTDEGIGIAPARRTELNHRLATRPPLDLAAVEAMGLTVVAYLAARHQIRVELRDGHRRGTIAEVTLPPELIVAGLRRPIPAVVPRPRTAISPAPAAPLFQHVDQPTGLPSWPPTPAPDHGGGTMELPLPIFEQVQRSRWFTPGESTEQADRPVSPATWQTPADAGWQAAAHAAAPQPAGTTHNGLPVRRPGAQLVPGGPTPPAATSGTRAPADDWRDPVKVSEVAAAYSRGLTTGRALVRSEVALAQRDGEPIS
jgi:signal transduction histidine kinase